MRSDAVAWKRAASYSNNSSRFTARGNVYVELQRHYNRAQEARNQAAIELARSLHLPLLATQGAQYAKPEERQILDVFTCIRNHRTLDTAGRLLARNSERYIKSPQEMLRLFADLPEATANTVELSSRLDFTLNDLGYEFPRYPVPEGETMDTFLRARTMEGARDRYVRPGQSELWQRAQRQIERELALIEKLKLAGYFLIVWDIVRYCREQGHSGAGARLGGQQRGLLFARHYRGRSRRHGLAVRALLVGRARRVARHRSRSAQRRSARARYPVCVSSVTASWARP